MSNTWSGRAFPPLAREASGLIRRPQCGRGGGVLNATVGCVMTMAFLLHLLIHCESEKMLGSKLLFNELMHIYYMFCVSTCPHTVHFLLLISLSFCFFISTLSIQHLLQLSKRPHFTQPGVTFNLEVLWLDSGSLHRPPNRLHPSVTVKPLLVLLSSKSNSELLHMQKPCCSDLTVTCSRMTANRGETLPMTSL